MSSKVSVIIPAYNSEKFIKRTLESVINQSFSDFEVIVVNDGSEDNTLEVVNKVISESARDDVNFKVIDKKTNEGVSSARNTGLEIATGEYVVFLDSDDVMLPNALRLLYSTIEEYSADLAWGTYEIVDENLSILWRYEDIFSLPSKRLISSEEILRAIFNGKIWIGLCTAIFRKSVIKKAGLKFTRGVPLAEDIEFVLKYIFHSEKIAFCGEDVMLYVQRPLSATKSSIRKRFHVYSTFKRLLKYFQTHGMREELIHIFENNLMKEYFVSNFVRYIVFSDDSLAKKQLVNFFKIKGREISIKSFKFKDRVILWAARYPFFQYLLGRIHRLVRKIREVRKK